MSKKPPKNGAKKDSSSSNEVRSLDHSLCINGQKGRAGELNGPPGRTFPLDEFISKSVCKKKSTSPGSKDDKPYTCTFTYDPSRFDKRMGIYNAASPLTGFVAAGMAFLLVLIIGGCIVAYCLVYRKSSSSNRAVKGGLRSSLNQRKSSSMKRTRSLKSKKSSIASRSKTVAGKMKMKSSASRIKSRVSKKKSRKSVNIGVSGAACSKEKRQ